MSRPGRDYDVVVVGARVAGAATAMLLARQGRRVLLVDRGRYGTDTVSTHALMRAGVLQLQRWGLLDRIQAAGTPPVQRTVFHYESGDVRVTLKPTAGVDALYAPRRTLLDAVLVDAAVEAGVDVRFGVRVTGLLREDGHVCGVVATDGQRELVVPAPLTVGADGIRSVVAAAAGARTERTGSSAAGVLYGYVADLDTEGYEWFYGGHTAAGFIPTNDGQVCVFVGAPADRIRAMTGNASQRYAELLGAVSSAAAARVQAARRVGRLRGFPGMAGYLRQAAGRGWALVGDAGYYKDPLSTHGISDALRDAELLARDATSARGADSSAALHVYQRERDRLAVPMLDISDRIASYRWDEISLRRELLALNSAMGNQVEALVALDEAKDVPAHRSLVT
jgi:2-polyprenyl-6-methoxyphenol hydroxylase-like FAD-dependent oxidoreductase